MSPFPEDKDCFFITIINNNLIYEDNIERIHENHCRSNFFATFFTGGPLPELTEVTASPLRTN